MSEYLMTLGPVTAWKVGVLCGLATAALLILVAALDYALNKRIRSR